MRAAPREHTIPGWTELEREFDAWSAQGSRATFWWRDDDATRPGPRLERLLTIAGARPVSLAVIPTEATPELARRLRDAPNVTVLQHGYAHANHAPPGEKKAEFGDHRPLSAMIADAVAGRARLQALFGARFLPVFVPPWNRFAATLPAALAPLGFIGMSAFGRRCGDTAMRALNCHADIIDWRGGRDFLGVEPVLAQLVDHLSMRRTGAAAAAEPTGLLTHHKDHDGACWRFVEDLTRTIENHPAAAWRPSAQEFAPS